MLVEPLILDLEFARAEQAGDPFAFRFPPPPQEYVLRRAGGGFENASFPWDETLLADLEGLRRAKPDPAIVQRLGDTLRQFLSPMGWAKQEEQILQAVKERCPVILTIRSAASELYVLPWELLTLKSSGQHLGELENVLIRYEWPDTHSTPETLPYLEGGRILFCFSAAAGAVPAAEHQEAIQRACAAGFYAFDAEKDVLRNASCRRLAQTLEAADKEGQPFAVLHLLCHGSAQGNSYGLGMNGDGEGGGPTVVDGGRLRQILAPYAGRLRLVVLSACDSSNSGALGNHLGSVAQTLHRAGIAAVVASRYPLSMRGSIRMTEVLYEELLSSTCSLENALRKVRRCVAEDAAYFDWAALQLYARAEDGHDSRPVAFRPFRGLLAFEPQHHRFFFGRRREIEEILCDLKALIDGRKPRFLVVAGASGTGKSSVVLAGAVPRLIAEGAGWQVARIRPGSDPHKELAAALSGIPPTGPPGLLIVDQFEEVFTHVSDPAVRQAFTRRLWSLASDPGTRLSVIITLRVDFIGHCGELALEDGGRCLDRVAYDEAHRVFIAKLDSAHLRMAIEGPAEKLGLVLEEGLVSRMLEDVGLEPGALPALQDALDLLWQRRRGRTLTQRAYDEIGGVAGALHRRADAIIDGLSEPGQKAARKLLVRLVSTGTEASLSTRRRVPLEKLRPAKEDGEFVAILGRAVAARLLVCDGEGKGQLVEIAHEALIRRWPRLSKWVQEDHKLMLELETVEGWIRQYEKDGTLLTGKQLGYLEQIGENPDTDLPPNAHTLLAKSKAAEKRQRRRRQATLVALSLWLVVSLIGGLTVVLFGLIAADSNRNAVRLANRLVATAEEDLESIPGTEKIREDLHKFSRELLDALDADYNYIGHRSSRNETLVLQASRLRKLGGEKHVQRAARLLEEARASYVKLELKHPSNMLIKGNLAVTYGEIGDLNIERGQLAEAQASYEKQQEVLERAIKMQPGSYGEGWGYYLIVPQCGLATVALKRQDLATARRWAQAAEASWQKFEQSGFKTPPKIVDSMRDRLATVKKQLAN